MQLCLVKYPIINIIQLLKTLYLYKILIIIINYNTFTAAYFAILHSLYRGSHYIRLIQYYCMFSFYYSNDRLCYCGVFTHYVVDNSQGVTLNSFLMIKSASAGINGLLHF